MTGPSKTTPPRSPYILDKYSLIPLNEEETPLIVYTPIKLFAPLAHENLSQGEIQADDIPSSKTGKGSHPTYNLNLFSTDAASQNEGTAENYSIRIISVQKEGFIYQVLHEKVTPEGESFDQTSTTIDALDDRQIVGLNFLEAVKKFMDEGKHVTTPFSNHAPVSHRYILSNHDLDSAQTYNDNSLTKKESSKIEEVD